ncbi:acyltransferase family protein [Microbacterium hydrocarbonoxydans]|uniref:acyltransferase family protein n=1 Tax=Microbacterium hydrocarbonoxydans TaxID=273678 RepID=UPI00203FCB16|nr:acyltransferase [Microbacterium hydrocarbonoxydans]MCM3780061.1 acyltransferase [Microbacterium hydrocarbonoxydans]
MSSLDVRSNSFGLLRLTFALLVIVSHTWPLGGFGNDPGRLDNNLGIFAVEGFFALSGFLITMSGSRLSVGRFLWHRVLRIFPGYWVSLVIVALALAPIVWRTMRGLTEYPFASPPPSGFIFSNALLFQNQIIIGDTLTGIPAALIWNGPLYTLPMEFACYLLIAILMAGRVLTARMVAALAAAAWVWVQVAQIGALGVYDDRQAKFTLCFLVGSLIYFLRDRLLAGTRWLPPVALVVLVGTYLTWGFHQLGLVAWAFLVLWVAYHLPFKHVGRTRDFSYGIYIYGWPVQQMAAYFGATQLGILPYMLICISGTLILAVGSWYLIESPALRWKDRDPLGWFRRQPANVTS